MELRVPPPLVALFTGALMWWTAGTFPSLSFSLPAHLVVAITFAAIGVITAASGVVAFRRAHTSLDPTRPGKASSLVDTGVFACTRNPMYLGLLLALTGWSVWLSSAAALVFLPLFVWYINRFQIAPEEKVLASLFGKEFADYKRRVRRWV